MQSPVWVQLLKDLWWLWVLLLTIVGGIFKLGYTTSKLANRFNQTEANQQKLLTENATITETLKELAHRTDHLEDSITTNTKMQQAHMSRIDRNIAQLRRRDNATIRATFAMLDGFKQLNCNGAVTTAHAELRKYVLPIEEDEEEET